MESGRGSRGGGAAALGGANTLCALGRILARGRMLSGLRALCPTGCSPACRWPARPPQLTKFRANTGEYLDARWVVRSCTSFSSTREQKGRLQMLPRCGRAHARAVLSAAAGAATWSAGTHCGRRLLWAQEQLLWAQEQLLWAQEPGAVCGRRNLVLFGGAPGARC